MRAFAVRVHVNDDAWGRVIALAALAVVGLALAGIGSGFGLAGGIADGGRIAEVSIDGSNVTVSDNGSDVVLTETVSETSDIEVVDDGGEITVAERAGDPFAQRERERAVEIARRNETVASYLQTVDDAEFAVEPVENVPSEELQTDTVRLDASEANGTVASGGTVQVVNVTVDESGDSATIDREPTSVEDRAVVQIDAADQGDSRYWVDVDLADGTVTDVTDWNDT